MVFVDHSFRGMSTRSPLSVLPNAVQLLLLLGFQRSDRVGVGVGRRASISLRVKNLQHVGSDIGNGWDHEVAALCFQLQRTRSATLGSSFAVDCYLLNRIHPGMFWWSQSTNDHTSSIRHNIFARHIRIPRKTFSVGPVSGTENGRFDFYQPFSFALWLQFIYRRKGNRVGPSQRSRVVNMTEPNNSRREFDGQSFAGIAHGAAVPPELQIAKRKIARAGNRCIATVRIAKAAVQISSDRTNHLIWEPSMDERDDDQVRRDWASIENRDY